MYISYTMPGNFARLFGKLFIKYLFFAIIYNLIIADTDPRRLRNVNTRPARAFGKGIGINLSCNTELDRESRGVAEQDLRPPCRIRRDIIAITQVETIKRKYVVRAAERLQYRAHARIVLGIREDERAPLNGGLDLRQPQFDQSVHGIGAFDHAQRSIQCADAVTHLRKINGAGLGDAAGPGAESAL